ncbi:pentapeptide repeat-containing protein [Pantoea allii]|uniref:pentapeptide repeat-containing protein n=1 Tax=Pantoea allii TaxID=574096 RepID=UPI0024B6EFEA|nr:pentapeptide repeat-containing protein [Pantoea allii]MDJ0036450.1 pentapeptide repeat-containing protein [Pantoea allii]
MSNTKKKSFREKVLDHPVNSLISIFFIYLFATLFFSFAFPWLSKVVLPHTSAGIYNKEFWVNLLVNLNASLIDFVFFGIALFLLQRRNERNSAITEMMNELSDISKYKDQVVNLRKIGLIRRLGELKHYKFTMHRMVISGDSIEVRDIIFKNSDFTGMEGENIYVNGMDVSYSSLMSSTFNKSKIKNAAFNFCNLKNIKFKDAKLRNTTFASCNLSGANLNNTDLQSVKLAGCNMENVNFEGAILDRASLKGAKNLDIVQLCKAKSLNYIALEDHLKLQIKSLRPDVRFSK